MCVDVCVDVCVDLVHLQTSLQKGAYTFVKLFLDNSLQIILHNPICPFGPVFVEPSG